jgi:hypothetical protein
MVIDDDQRQSMGTKDCGNSVASMATAINGGVKPQYAVCCCCSRRVKVIASNNMQINLHPLLAPVVSGRK